MALFRAHFGCFYVDFLKKIGWGRISRCRFGREIRVSGRKNGETVGKNHKKILVESRSEINLLINGARKFAAMTSLRALLKDFLQYLAVGASFSA